MSMIALSGTRTSSLQRAGLPASTNACTVTSRGMSCADTRATHVSATIRNRAARRAALRDRRMGYLVDRSRPDHALVRFRDRRHALVDEPLQRAFLPTSRSCRGCPSSRSRCCARRRTGRAAGRRRRRWSAPASVWRSTMRTLSFMPSAMKMYFCCGSFEKAMSQTEPDALRVLREEPFLDELAFGREHLEAIADAIADVDEPIDRHVGAVHRVVELLRGRRGRDRTAAAACRPACCRRRPTSASSCRCRHRAPATRLFR